MEEQRDLKSSDRVAPSPPVLGLQVVQQNRTTNFFIDNILRPDFGCRKDPGPDPGLGLREHSSAPVLRPNLPGTPNPDPNLDSGCSSDSTSSSSSSSSSPKQSSRTGPGPAGPGGPGTLTDSDGVQTEDRTGGGDRVRNGTGSKAPDSQPLLWPAWVYCTRYSDRPSSGPRTRKLKKSKSSKEDKRPRTAFTAEQLQRLKTEFQVNRYITEQRRQVLAQELNLNESQIKIWFQNKRAKIKKASGFKNGLALQLMAQGLYNHSTTTIQEDKEDSE